MDADTAASRAGEIFLDHVAHFVADRDAAAKALARAGFAPTPISIQTDGGKLTGTGNVTAMMTRGYIEVLFKTADTPLGQELDRALARYSGRASDRLFGCGRASRKRAPAEPPDSKPRRSWNCAAPLRPRLAMRKRHSRWRGSKPDKWRKAAFSF